MIERYQAYPEYKESGVEWLGDIPSEWELWKLNHAFDEIGSGTTPPSSSDEWFGGDIPWVTTGELRESVIVDTTKKITQKTLRQFPTLRKYPKGSIAIAMYGATIGRLGVFGVEATTNQACCVLTKSHFIDNKYLYYWLQAFRQDIVNLASGGGQPNINQEVVASLKICAPDSVQQNKIANFLDHETAKIDTLIEKQQQLIKLLKEKRQAVISHAVTKGLNPDVPMRDSGVEWLGEVPEHWEVMQIRRILIEMEQGKSPECESREAESFEWGVLKTSCVNQAIYNSEANKALPTNIQPFPEYEVKQGDLLMSRASGSRNLIGSVAYVYETRSKILLSDKIFRLHIDSKVNRIFFSFLMQSSYMRSNIERAISGAEGMANNITKTAVMGFQFALPPNEEQDDIADRVSIKLEAVDELIRKAEFGNSIMQERRTALTSAAVTGKIDVRNWQPPKPVPNAAEASLV